MIDAALERKALVFLHIPKTAGTTLNRIIEWQYNPLRIFTVDPYRFRATIKRFETFSEKRRRSYQVVRGHLQYGIHEYLPQGAAYITLLREPAARVLSSYYFIQRRPLHPLHRQLKRERLGVEDFLRLTSERQNLQCRFIAGIGRDGVCDETTLEKAKENLRYFRVVGLVERFEESLLLIEQAFGWKVTAHESWKVSKNRRELEPSVLEMIREKNRLDLHLYEYATKLFEENLRQNELFIQEHRMKATPSSAPFAHMSDLYRSKIGLLRFLTSKVASAV